MTELTKRGLQALALGVLLFLVGLAFSYSGSSTLVAIAPLIDLASLVLMAVGLVLAVVGVARKSWTLR